MFRTIRGRLLFYVLAVTVPIYAGALYMSYQTTAERLEREAERDADQLAAEFASDIDAVIRPIEGGIRTVAHQLEEIDPPREQYEARIRGILAAWPNVYGSTIATEGDGFAPYLHRHGDDIVFANLALESYGYRDLPWYREAADSGLAVWSLPYFDAGGGETWMVTYSVPYFRETESSGRVLAGVVTADLDLRWMEQAASNITLGPTGMGWLVSPPGPRTFTAPIGSSGKQKTALAAPLDIDAIREAGEKMLAHGETLKLLPTSLSADRAYLAVRDLDTLAWRLMIVIPRAQLLADARALLQRQLLLGAVGLVLLVGAVLLIAAAITRPVQALADAVSVASEDQLAFALPEVSRRDEVGVLTDALRRLRDSLQSHVVLRAESLAAQARLDHELHIAAEIQQSMLPKGDSSSPLAGVTVASSLLAAKQVGGDLYDYFAVSADEFLFAIADVSDKGVPAALFMARVSTLLRTLATADQPPDRLLRDINARLTEDNDACMFVTLGCGMLNVRTGRIRYASAGHEAPLIVQPEGVAIEFPVINGAAIGIEPAADYLVTERILAPGDTLVLFTDGVTEASLPDGTLFGTQRLMDLLTVGSSTDPDTLIRRIGDAVQSDGFNTSDDCTMLAVCWRPDDVTPHRMHDGMHWIIEPEISAHGAAVAGQRLRTALAARQVQGERIADAELIAEELLTNIVRSLGSRADARVSLGCALTPSQIVLTLRDNGAPFNPLAHEHTALEADIAERSIGGLGIPLVRGLADDCRYANVEGWNVMEVRLNRTLA